MLWLLNSKFKIAGAMWKTDRTLSLTINLNTATDAELMTIPGIDFVTAKRIIAARHTSGYFLNLGDLNSVLLPELVGCLTSMADEMKQARPYQR